MTDDSKPDQYFIDLTKHHLTTGFDEDGDFQPYFMFMEADKDSPRVVYFPQLDGTHEGRLEVANAVLTLASAVRNLTSITFASDTWQAMSPTKHDGSPWEYGEMARAVAEQTIDADLVQEAAIYTIITLDEEVTTNTPYQRTETDGVKLLWDECRVLRSGSEGIQAKGFFPELMCEALTVPKIMDRTTDDGTTFEKMASEMGLSLDQAASHTLIAAIKMVMVKTQSPCMMGADDQEEAELIANSFKEGPQFGGHFRIHSMDDLREIDLLNTAFAAPSHDPSRDPSYEK